MAVGDIEILEIEPSKREDRGQPDRSAENFNALNIYAAAAPDKVPDARVFPRRRAWEPAVVPMRNRIAGGSFGSAAGPTRDAASLPQSER